MTYKGANFIAEALARLGVDHVFGIISIHNLPIVDAISRLGATRFITTRHELAAAHAADGYARASGKLGVVIASTGPGTSNTLTGLYEARYASSRVLLITTQAETKYYGKALSYVHESENQIPMLSTACRQVESPRSASDLATAFQNVVDDIYKGRPAPGAIEVPLDLQSAQVPPCEVSPPKTTALEPASRDVEMVSNKLKAASKRVIIAGGGVIAADASEALTRLAEKLDAPVITTEAGRGSIPEDHALCIGNYYASRKIHDAISSAEVSLAIGTKFAVGIAGQLEALRPPGELVHVDIDTEMIGRTHSTEFGVQADASAMLDELHAEIPDPIPNAPEFNQQVLATSARLKQSMRDRLGPDFAQIMDSIRDRMPLDSAIVRDQTVAAYNWGNQQLPILRPRTSIHPASGALGPGLPMSIGASLGNSQKAIVIHGDGGLMFHATELATAAQYKIPVIVCAFNDSGYGVLRWMQDKQFGRIAEADLGKVAFARLANSVGVPAQRVKSIDEFKAALEVAVATDGPYLIDVDMEHFHPMQSMTLLPKDSNEVDIDTT